MRNLALACLLLSVVLLSGALPGLAQLPTITPQMLGWQKITGQTANYSGATDGVMNDRQNSYLWSMAFHGDYLYAGTARNVVGLVLTQYKPSSWPPDVPVPTDERARIYRMKLSTGVWEPFYLANPLPPIPGIPFTVGPDAGYRMMKEYTAPFSKPVLYVGGMGLFTPARLLAIDAQNNAPVPIFSAPGFSVRGIAEYNSQLFWASEVKGYPTIWCDTNPLKSFQQNPKVVFEQINVPSDWFPKGAEVLDMVSYNGFLYVFFFDHDWDNGGFWCAKLKKVRGVWTWKLIVGDQSKGALYPKGMGRLENGGATPIIFNDKMYVGTISTTMWRFLNGSPPDFNNIPPTGTQIFRFDKSDTWERVMPLPVATTLGTEDVLNGFANPLNLYLWRFTVANGRLYAGTFDARVALEGFGMDLSSLNLWNPDGFDLYSTKDGTTWIPESVNGFGDKWNYGARTLLTNPANGDLYLGTANPFYGCQVWRKKAR